MKVDTVTRRGDRRNYKPSFLMRVVAAIGLAINHRCILIVNYDSGQNTKIL
jgi:Co/Zn/Cd efflux system component